MALSKVLCICHFYVNTIDIFKYVSLLLGNVDEIQWTSICNYCTSPFGFSSFYPSKKITPIYLSGLINEGYDCDDKNKRAPEN